MAALVDGLVVGVPMFLVLTRLGLYQVEATETSFELHTGPWGVLVNVAVPLLYSALLDGGPRGQTVGKRVAGIKVVDAVEGGVIGPGRAAVRRLLYNAFFVMFVIPGVINVLSPLWDPRRQAWHDKAVNSLVVKAGTGRLAPDG